MSTLAATFKALSPFHPLANSPSKNVEAKSNDINAMISPEGERVALGKVCSFLIYNNILIVLCLYILLRLL